jgi:hypothetical protein
VTENVVVINWKSAMLDHGAHSRHRTPTTHALIEALGHELAAIAEHEAFAGEQRTHRIRHEDLAGTRLGGDGMRGSRS